MAIKVERQLKQKGISKYNTGSGSSYKPSWKKEEKGIPKEAAKNKTTEDLKGKGKVETQSSRNRDIKCFKCLGSQCPNKRVMVLRDNIVESESEVINPWLKLKKVMMKLNMQLREKHL